MSYPMFLYHKEEAPDGRIFHTEEAVEALGEAEGWHDTPAAFEPGYKPPPKVVKMEGDGAIALANMGIVRVRYPAHFYTKGDSDNPILVNTEEEELALDHDVYKDTWDPKAWDTDVTQRDIETAFSVFTSPSPDAVKPEPVKPAEKPAEPLRGLTAAEREALYAKTVADIVPIIDQIESPTNLRAILVAEHNNPKGERKTIVKAVQARLRQLAIPDVVMAQPVNEVAPAPDPNPEVDRFIK